MLIVVTCCGRINRLGSKSIIAAAKLVSKLSHMISSESMIVWHPNLQWQLTWKLISIGIYIKVCEAEYGFNDPK